MSKFDSEIDRLKSNIELNQSVIERIVGHIRNGITAEEPVLKRLMATNEHYNRVIESYRRLGEA